jgi:hypothetical protein
LEATKREREKMGRSEVTARQHRPAQRKLLPSDTGMGMENEMEMVVEIEEVRSM